MLTFTSCFEEREPDEDDDEVHEIVGFDVAQKVRLYIFGCTEIERRRTAEIKREIKTPEISENLCCNLPYTGLK